MNRRLWFIAVVPIVLGIWSFCGKPASEVITTAVEGPLVVLDRGASVDVDVENSNARSALVTSSQVVAEETETEDGDIKRQAVSRARDAAKALIDAKMNIYFDRDQYAEEWLSRNERLVQDLAQLLAEPPTPMGATAVASAPAQVSERMAAIDALEGIADMDSGDGVSAEHARETLGQIVTWKLPVHLSQSAKQIMVSEKFDSLAALARVAPTAAFARLISLSAEQQRILKPALLLGFVDDGMPREQAIKELERLALRVK